jgi:hypothetical protein
MGRNEGERQSFVDEAVALSAMHGTRGCFAMPETVLMPGTMSLDPGNGSQREVEAFTTQRRGDCHYGTRR